MQYCNTPTRTILITHNKSSICSVSFFQTRKRPELGTRDVYQAEFEEVSLIDRGDGERGGLSEEREARAADSTSRRLNLDGHALLVGSPKWSQHGADVAERGSGNLSQLCPGNDTTIRTYQSIPE